MHLPFDVTMQSSSDGVDHNEINEVQMDFSSQFKDNSDSKKTSHIVKYTNTSSGPFIVYIRKIETSFNSMKMTKYLYEKYKHITSIKPIGKNKLKLFCSLKDEANIIPLDPNLIDYRVYIPVADAQICGSIYLDTGSDLNEFIDVAYGKFNQAGLPKIKILSVHRNKKIVDGKEVELDTVRITFEGTALPDRVCFYNLLIPVRLYISKPLFCDSCLRFGHTNKMCDHKPVCSKCGDEHKTSVCTENVIEKCTYCEQDHAPNSKNCQLRIEKQNKLMHKIRNKSNKSFRLLQEVDLSSGAGNEKASSVNSSRSDKDVTKRKRISPKRKHPTEQNYAENYPQLKVQMPQNEKSQQSSTKGPPPGFRKDTENDLNSWVSETIINFVTDLNFPPWSMKIIELIVIPFVQKILNKINASLSSQLVNII